MKRLNLRLDEVRNAIALLSKCEDPDAADEEYEKALRPFLDGSSDFNSAIKQKMLGRRLRGMVKALREDGTFGRVAAFVSAINPFPAKPSGLVDSGRMHEPDDEVDEQSEFSIESRMPFEPEAPLMNQMDGSPLERLLLSHKIVTYDVLKPLLQSGEDMARVTLLVARATMQMLDDALEQLEDCPDETEEMLLACRGLVTLLDLADHDAMDPSAVKSLAKAYKSDKTGMLADVSICMHGCEFYTGLVDDFLAHLPGSKERTQQLSAKATEIKECNMMLKDFVPVAKAAVSMVATCRACMRVGSTTFLEKALQLKLEEQFSRLKGLSSEALASELGDAADFRSLLTEAEDLWGDSSPIPEMLAWATSAAMDVMTLSTWEQALALLEKSLPVDAQSAIGEEAAMALQQMLPTLMATKVPEAARGTVQNWARACARSIGATWPRCCQHLDMVDNILNMCTDGSEDDKNFMKLLLALQEASSAMDTWTKLGASTGDRTLADRGRTTMKALLHKQAAVDAMLENFEPPGWPTMPAGTVATTIRNDIAESSAFQSERQKKALEDAISNTMPTSLGGVEGKSWHESLQQDASLEDLFELAKTTLLQIPAATIRQRESTIQGAMKEYKLVCGLFGMRVDEDTTSKAEQVLANLALTYTEALLSTVFQDAELPATKLKSKVHGIRKQVKDEVWSRVVKQYQQRFALALKLKGGQS